MSLTKSPCINKCMAIATGGDGCKSCGRTTEEALNWIGLNDEQKKQINKRILLERFEQGHINVAKINRSIDQ